MSRSRKTRGRVVGATAGELHPNAAVGAKGLAALARNVADPYPVLNRAADGPLPAGEGREFLRPPSSPSWTPGKRRQMVGEGHAPVVAVLVAFAKADWALRRYFLPGDDRDDDGRGDNN
jgi:hypothetical protein